MADEYPPDYDTTVGRVRKYIPDIVKLSDPALPNADPSYLWSDDAIQSFVDDQDGDDGSGGLAQYVILRAAASILIATANNESLVLKKITTEDLQTDGPSVANALIRAAEKLQARADDIEEAVAEDVFMIVPYTHVPPRFDWR